VPIEYTNNNDSDNKKLIDLLDQFDSLLTEIITEKAFFKDNYIRDMIHKIWHNQLRETLQKIKNLLSEKEYLAKLEQVGLTGDQLNLKLYIFNNFNPRGAKRKENINRGTEIPAFRHTPSQTPLKIPLTKSSALGILGFFNSLLGSLSIVTPIAESIKEFKDMVHFEIEHGTKP